MQGGAYLAPAAQWPELTLHQHAYLTIINTCVRAWRTCSLLLEQQIRETATHQLETAAKEDFVCVVFYV